MERSTFEILSLVQGVSLNSPLGGRHRFLLGNDTKLTVRLSRRKYREP